MWNNYVTKVYIVPVVFGTLGMVSKYISRYLEITGFHGLEKLKKACLLGTTKKNDKVFTFNIVHFPNFEISTSLQ